MENDLYFIGTKIDLKKLTTHVGLAGDNEVAYFDFWNNVCIIEYNTKTKVYIVKDNLLEPQYYTCISDRALFRCLDDHEIQVVYDLNPLGAIFQSYAMAHLALVRWAADVAYTRDLWNNLIEG